MTNAVTTPLYEDIKRSTDMLIWWGENEHNYAPLVKQFQAAGFDVKLSQTGVDVAGSGGKDKIVAAFRIMRAHGFDREQRPGPNETYYSGFFTHPHLKSIWFSFSSTVCQRVKVGTEMREVDLYEVRCGETLEIPNE
jgi:hypothetical protein